MEDKHPQTLMMVFDKKNMKERTFYCDIELTDTLEYLNSIGAVTVFSCQNLDGKGTIQIGFSHDVPKDIMLHAELFLMTTYLGYYLYYDVNDTFDIVAYLTESEDLVQRRSCVQKCKNPISIRHNPAATSGQNLI